MLRTIKIMRNISIVLLTAALAFGTAADVLAQKKKTAGDKRAPFEKGDNTLAVGLGFGVAYGYIGSTVALPALLATFDHGIISNAGPGTVGIGGIIGVKLAHYNYAYGGYRANYTSTIVAARGTYHLTILKDKNNKFDPYGGVMAGLRIYNYSDDNPGSFDESSVYPTTGLFVGAKYNFTPAFGAWSELGYDIAFLKLGVNFNF